VKTLAIINQKGGVGKTTTVANLGAAIAARGHRLCLVDMDPQAHLTLHVGLEPGENTPGVYELLTDNAPVSEAAVKINDRLSAIPAVIDLAAAETELVTVVGREQILSDQLAAAKSDYDYVMIDCPPSLGLLTLNALAAADYVFIPLQAHFLALQGLGMLLETVSLVRQRINPKLKVGGVILCMHEKQTRLAGEVVADIEEFLEAARGADVPWADAGIFETPIRRNIKLAECPSYGKTIFDYDPYSHGAMDYDSLAEEFMSFFNPNSAPAVRSGEPIAQTSEADEPAEQDIEEISPPPEQDIPSSDQAAGPIEEPVGHCEPQADPNAGSIEPAENLQETSEDTAKDPQGPVAEPTRTVDESPQQTARSDEVVDESHQPAEQTDKPVEDPTDQSEQPDEIVKDSPEPAEEPTEQTARSDEVIDESHQPAEQPVEPIEEFREPTEQQESGEFRSESQTIVRHAPASVSTEQPTIGETD